MSWRERGEDKVYSEAEVLAFLAERLPKWELREGWIRRTYKTSGWKGTLMVVNTIGHLAEVAFQHPDLVVS